MSKQKQREPRRGVVLGAGGVLGAAWMMGALEALHTATALEPRDVEIVVGTSAGSILAAFAGSGVSVDVMSRHQRDEAIEGDPVIAFDYDHDTGGSLPPRPRLRLGSPGLLRSTVRHPLAVTPMTAVMSLLPAGRGSLQAVGDLVAGVAPQEWPTTPKTWIVAMDYETGKRVVFGRDGAPRATLPDAVRASCAIPAWFEPVTIDGHRYTDGGTCSSTSADLLAPLGLDEVYVLAPMATYDDDRPRDLITKLERRYRRTVTRRLDREVAKVRASGARVVVLAPNAEDLRAIGANLMDASRRLDVFHTATRTTAASLAMQGVRQPSARSLAG
ncbi:MAG TPA: patatin-like phospholipase family protein [Mycobacteriales bacterium]|nr:patatin-like phospholipase family protein [Mycobacteriales bacterium]